MTNATPPTAPQQLAPRLRAVRVGLREDLEVSRHLFRGAPCYVVRDPITFQSQRFDPSDYAVLVALNTSEPLSEIFDQIVADGAASAEDEEQFYGFVMSLQRLGFLRLPISDDKRLYQRYQAKQKERRKQKWMSFLFFRIPVWNPNAFLDRTIHLARPLYSQAAFFVWLILMIVAGFVAARNWSELAEPLQGVLATRNLVVMWFTLIGLKVFHEFGHAYACKHYGGHVPEMGIYMILMTPCAYMDATASWGFTRRRERLVVCFGGMYVESFIAALAMFVWAMTEPSFLHSLAYNVILLASIVTALFNINPLMRYDGYFILSDLTEIPNLRSKATQYVTNVLKWLALGLPTGWEQESRRLKAILLSYGIAVSLYRVGLILGIAALLAMKMLMFGLGLAVWYVGSTVVKTLRRLTTYLWYAEECVHTRRRALALSFVALAVIPGALVAIPIPSSVHAMGVLTRENETVVRAHAAGTLERSHITVGGIVHPGDAIASLANDAYTENVAAARANMNVLAIRRDAFQVADPNLALQAQDKLEAEQVFLRIALEKLDGLEIEAPVAGFVVDGRRRKDRGRFVAEGEPVATIVSGNWQVRAVFTETDLASAKPRIGDDVVFRATGKPDSELHGRIVRIAPAGQRIIRFPALTQIGGGDITVDPRNGEASEPYFEMTVDLGNEMVSSLRHGMTGNIRLEGSAESLRETLYRRFARFVNKLMKG